MLSSLDNRQEILNSSDIEEALEELEEMITDDNADIIPAILQEKQILEKMLEDGDVFYHDNYMKQYAHGIWIDQIPDKLIPFINWELIIDAVIADMTVFEIDGETYYC